MSNLPSSPLRDIVRRAAESKGSGIAEAAKQKEAEQAVLRLERLTRSKRGVKVLVCDYSGSMSSLVQGQRKFEHLKRAVNDCMKTWPGIKIAAFSSMAEFVDSANDIPDPSQCGGGTDLSRALNLVATLNPERTVVITDGYPDNRATSLTAARAMTGIVDVVYCGDDTDTDAIAFMQELASAGCGQQVTWNAGRLGLGAAVVSCLMIGTGR